MTSITGRLRSCMMIAILLAQPLHGQTIFARQEFLPPEQRPSPRKENQLSPQKIVQRQLESGGRHVFRLPVGSTERFEIDAISSSFDAFLQIYDANGNIVAQNDDGGTNRNAKIFFQRPTDGWTSHYFVAISSIDEDGGSYDLAVRVREFVTPNAPRIISIGESLTGKLEENSESDSNGFFDRWILNIERPARLRIDLVSRDFDSVLRLRSGDTLVAEDDDGGGTPNSRIVWRARDPGRYDLQARTFPGEKGEYTLAVTAMPEPRVSGEPEPISAPFSRVVSLEPDSPVIERLNSAVSSSAQTPAAVGACRVSQQERPFHHYFLAGAAQQKLEVRVQQEGQTTRRCTLVVEAGLQTAAGFASLWRRSNATINGLITETLLFEKQGNVVIRVSTDLGNSVAYKISVESR